MNVRLYERLTMARHRLGRIYCRHGNVKELYLKRHAAKDWDEKDERDAMDFLDLEQDIYWKCFQTM